MEKQQAAGSIWNPNSWHWQMKNYTNVAKKLIEEKLLALELKDGDVVITSTKVRFPKAEVLQYYIEAEVNIRKGKQYLLYEFDLEVDFQAKSKLSLAQNSLNEVEVDGTYKIKDINHDDLDEITVEEVKTTQKSALGEKVKGFLKKILKVQITQQFLHFQEDLAKFESDPAKLEADRKRRQEAQLATQKAREEKGEEKERLLQQQKEKEQRMKEEFSKLQNK